MDEIRAKRLAKLGGQTAPTSQPTPAGTGDLPSPGSPPPPAQAPVTPGVAQPMISTPSLPATPPEKKRRNSTSMDVDQKEQVAHDAGISALAKWEHEALQAILGVSLQPTSSPSLTYVPELAKELEAEGFRRLEADLVDRVVVFRLSMLGSATGSGGSAAQLDYLIGCFDRAFREERIVTGLSEANKKLETLGSLKKIVVSYSGLIIQMPEMFASDGGRCAQTLADKIMSGELEPEFLRHMVMRFSEDGLELIFNPVLLAISSAMRQQSFTKNFTGPIQGLVTLAAEKSLAQLACSLPFWCPKGLKAREFEMVSFLGPFFRPSTFYEDDKVLGDQYFPNPTRTTLQEMDASVNSLRLTLNNYQRALHMAVKKILTSGPECRERTLQFISEAIVANEGRAKMQTDPAQVSTDGFMLNLASVCLRLSEPFTDPGAKKLELIDRAYPLKSSRYHVAKETRLRALSDELDEWEKANLTPEQKAAYEPKFVTECLFQTSHLLHLGVIKTFHKYTTLLKDISEIQKAIKRVKEGPPMPQADMILQRLQQQLDICIRAKFCCDVQLLDPELLGGCFRFYNFVCEYLCSLAFPDLDGAPVQPAPLVFRALPEFFVEDITEFFLFVTRFSPTTLLVNTLKPLMEFMTLFFAQPDYIKSPHLRSKFAEVLYMLTPSVQRESRIASLEEAFSCSPVVLRNLARVLMAFYQEVEQTGSSHQFYEKFNVRYHISIVLKLLWDNEQHRQRVREESNTDGFVRFVNLLLNDTTYLLDESLSMLTEIHNTQEKMKDQNAWNALPENERKELEQAYHTNERRCKSLLFLAKETLHMLSYLTADIPRPFLRPQILERLVAMLNYNVAQLVGPKCQELKVQNPEKYGFEPKSLLSIIMEVYIHLYDPIFIEAMAKEGRSYQRAHFQKACSILRRFLLKPLEEIERIEQLVQRVEEVKEEEARKERDMGEIPDEFLDPITCVPMKDPVLLPTSKTIVDRSTIETHLLSDTIDPFNRMPLSLDMVIPETELKARIEAFFRKH